mmetsp:Transcript_5403/g.9445  ORF Transcript_5403/g.9445 Transcript_5403/m.9445 type:complete len:203 (+) Transcript_5403:444-1052(+)|eukprot:CAMPEP_0178874304 /NCGR_PEP_ID=MMETSP0747-20121128/9142_1 /TAXON_ID=913974 /ORGANISM="Nitzschia punctata, Strain CCMP561" /LENGTH=202 /DNA_ID=CAMNT_0020541689 /DNA_START=378 /DNA_END=986 /DNA_ORIENTATION=+
MNALPQAEDNAPVKAKTEALDSFIIDLRRSSWLLDEGGPVVDPCTESSIFPPAQSFDEALFQVSVVPDNARLSTSKGNMNDERASTAFERRRRRRLSDEQTISPRRSPRSRPVLIPSSSLQAHQELRWRGEYHSPPKSPLSKPQRKGSVVYNFHDPQQQQQQRPPAPPLRQASPHAVSHRDRHSATPCDAGTKAFESYNSFS